MRKTLTLLFAAALVVVFALPAGAQQAQSALGKYIGAADFNVRGFSRFAGSVNNNQYDFDDDSADNHNYWWTRNRWFFDSSMEGKYGATLGFEWSAFWGQDLKSMAGSFGNPDYPQTLQGGVNSGRGENLGDTLPNNWRLRAAYLWFFVPGSEVKVTGGLQSISLDPDNIMFANNEMYYGIRADMPIIKGVLNLSTGWLKQDMGKGFLANDSAGAPIAFTGSQMSRSLAPYLGDQQNDMYFFNLTGSLNKWFNFGTYMLYNNVREDGGTFLDTSNPDSALGGRPQFWALDGNYFWNGAYIQLNPGIFYLSLHGNYFYADQKKYAKYTYGISAKQPKGALTATATPAEGDMDPSGWAFIGRIGLRPPGPFRFTINGFWFSGNDDDVFDPDHPEWSRWSTPDGNFGGYGQEVLFQTGFFPQGGGTSQGYSPGGMAGISWQLVYQATKKLQLEHNLGYFWFTSADDKWRLTNPNVAFIGTGKFGHGNNDLGIGWENDLHLNYKIYSNLEFNLAAGYFIADSATDHLEFSRKVSNKNGQYVMVPKDELKGGDDAWKILYRINYTF